MSVNFTFNISKEVRSTKTKKDIVSKEVSISLPKPILENDLLKHLIPKSNENYAFDNYAYDVICDLIDDKNIALTGHTGTGKTSLITELAARIGQPIVKVNLSEQTSIHDFIGRRIAENGSTKWIDGSLLFAMRNGGWLLIDEVDGGVPGILIRLNGVVEDRQILVQENNNELVVAHPNFRIIMTANTIGCMSQFRHLYQGTRALSAAFLGRLRVYHVGFLAKEDETKVMEKEFLKIILKKYPHLSKNKNDKEILELKNYLLEKNKGIRDLIERMVDVANKARLGFEESEIENFILSTRLLKDWVESTIRHECPFEGARVSLYSKIEPDQRPKLDEYIDVSMPKNEDINKAFIELQKNIPDNKIKSLGSPEEEFYFLEKKLSDFLKEIKKKEGLSSAQINSHLKQENVRSLILDSSKYYTVIAQEIRDLHENGKIDYYFSTKNLEDIFDLVIAKKLFGDQEKIISAIETVLKSENCSSKELSIIRNQLVMVLTP